MEKEENESVPTTDEVEETTEVVETPEESTDEVVEPVEDLLKEVAGETARERALRLELKRVRAKKDAKPEAAEAEEEITTSKAETLKEEGKKEILKNQAQAKVMASGSGKSAKQLPEQKKKTRKRVLPKKSGGFESWVK